MKLVLITGCLMVLLIFGANSASLEDTFKTEIGEPLNYDLDGNAVFATQSTACLAEINAERSRNGKSRLSANGQVQNAARKHNEHMIMNNCFAHQCSGEPDLGGRITAAGYHWSGIAENLFKGSQNANCRDAVREWMNSDGHRKNLLGNYKHLGCAGRSGWWTCDFAS